MQQTLRTPGGPGPVIREVGDASASRGHQFLKQLEDTATAAPPKPIGAPLALQDQSEPPHSEPPKDAPQQKSDAMRIVERIAAARQQQQHDRNAVKAAGVLHCTFAHACEHEALR